MTVFIELCYDQSIVIKNPRWNHESTEDFNVDTGYFEQSYNATKYQKSDEICAGSWCTNGPDGETAGLF